MTFADWEKLLPHKTEQSERRLKVCRSCPLYDAKWRRCTGCGCFMDVKVLFEGSTCPQGNWKE